MAYADMYSNNKSQNNGLYNNPTTNGLIFENPNSTVDPSRIRMNYWNNMIKMIIEPKLNNGSQLPEWDKINSITAYLTPSRAMAFLEAINKFESDESIQTVGVLCKDAMLKVSRGNEFGKPGTYIVIEKVANRDDLTPISTYIYECGGALNEYLVNDGTEKFVPLDLVDYSFIKTTLSEFIAASTGAVASSVSLVNAYNNNYTREYLKAIAKNLGVEIQTGNTNQRNNGVPGRTPGGIPQNTSSFNNDAPATQTVFTGNVEDDLLG